jgi:hypothetical protein
MRCFRQDRSIVGMGSEQIERVALGLGLHYFACHSALCT